MRSIACCSCLTHTHTRLRERSSPPLSQRIDQECVKGCQTISRPTTRNRSHKSHRIRQTSRKSYGILELQKDMANMPSLRSEMQLKLQSVMPACQTAPLQQPIRPGYWRSLAQLTNAEVVVQFGAAHSPCGRAQLMARDMSRPSSAQQEKHVPIIAITTQHLQRGGAERDP